MSAVLTVEELASELRCGIHQAYALVNTGQVHSVRVGRSIRVPRQALDAFLNEPAPLAPEANPVRMPPVAGLSVVR